jgi:hypothetical protein
MSYTKSIYDKKRFILQHAYKLDVVPLKMPGRVEFYHNFLINFAQLLLQELDQKMLVNLLKLSPLSSVQVIEKNTL